MKKYWSSILFVGTLIISTIWLFYIYGIAIEVYPTKIDESKHIHRTLYVDTRFSDEEASAIELVAKRWTEATNHIADIDVVLMPADVKVENRWSSIMVLNESPSFPPVVVLDRDNHNSTCGVYNGSEMEYPVIAIITQRIDNVNLFQQVVMHEVGHALGLKHLTGDDNFFTLMYPNTGLMAPGITPKDLAEFCQIYHCDSRKLKNEEEPFHS
jgi:hypothetical protein